MARVRKRDRHKLTTGRRHMTPEQRAEALTAYVSGELVKIIAARYERHPGVIQRLVRKASAQRGHRYRDRLREQNRNGPQSSRVG